MIVNRDHAETAWAVLLAAEYPGESVGAPMPESPGEVNASYRKAAAHTHPDAPGGSIEAFAKVDRAKHILLKWLEKQSGPAAPAPAGAAPCPACDGKGFVTTKAQRGFKITELRRQCRRCNGTGEDGVEHDKGDWG